jgi:uncharacterized repeat protein (TIGR03806 family)
MRRAALLLVCALLAGCSRAPEPVNFIADGKPPKLSDWRVLTLEGHTLVPNQGVVPYELNTPLFSDYAHKLRTVWMPAGAQGSYHASDVFDLPVGTILSKTFYYPRGGEHTVRQTDDMRADFSGAGLDLDHVKLVETRLLVRRADGWVALPYVWNDAQTEATLARTGDQHALELVDDQGARTPFTYVVPNENQCASCHVTHLKSKQLQPIGLKARHLNRDYAYASASENQLAHWVKLGYLAGVPTGELPRAANWRDESAPLVARARAYLDINCAHCHSARAAASNTALSLDAFAPVDRTMGLCKPAVAAGKGTGNRPFGIVPGRPDDSIMLYRLASAEGGEMMPELGRSTVHREGVELIRQWIASLPGRCSAEP